MKAVRLLIFLLVFFGAHGAHAVQPDEMLADPALEARARTISRELRCLVCQNQAIDDSAAPLARDLRILVRERLQAGDSDGQVVDFLVARYGEFVLLRPRFEWQTAFLWLAPFGVLIFGAAGLFVVMKRRGRFAAAGLVGAEPKLTTEEEARLAQLTKSFGE
jgi:cytochrome c-type biogenesis protein CcmH